MSNPEQFEIHGITFTEQGALIQYIRIPTDVRVKGAVVMQHQVTLDGRHPDYREDLEFLHNTAVRVLKNALDDFEESEPWIPERDDEDEDDDRGMGE